MTNIRHIGKNFRGIKIDLYLLVVMIRDVLGTSCDIGIGGIR